MNKNVSMLDVDLAINSIVNKLTFYSPFQRKNFFKSSSKRQYPKNYEVEILFKFLDIPYKSRTVSYNLLIEKLYNAISLRSTHKKNEKIKHINNEFLKYLKEKIKIDPSYLIENECVDFIFFHGSVGDKTFIQGASDIDILIGINTCNLTSLKDFKNLICQVSRFNISLLKTDPLQHHGVMFLFDYQYNNYIKSYFPEELIEFGTFLKGRVKLKSKRKIEIEKKFLEFLKKEVEHIINTKKFIGFYHFKSLISTLLMIMIFKRQINFNYYGYKKVILELIMNEENIIEKKLLSTLTNFRSELRYKSNISFLNHLKFLNPLYIKAAYQIESIIRFYFSDDKKKLNQTKKLIQSFLNE